MKHSLNREELIEQLKELAAQELPTYLANHMGAMCYEPSMEDNITACCNHCHRTMFYYAYHSDEDLHPALITLHSAMVVHRSKFAIVVARK